MYKVCREKLIEGLVELKLAEENGTQLWSLENLPWVEVEILCCGYLGATESLGAIGNTYKARLEILA